VQVWFQNRRAKFRRNERSILAQRSQLQQFAAASVSRKCAGSSPSQLIDDLHQRQRHFQQQQQQRMVESSSSPAERVTSSESSSWHACLSLPLPSPPHYVQSAAAPPLPAAQPAATDDLFLTGAARGAVPPSARCYSSPTTDSSVLQRPDDDVVRHQTIKEFTTAYATQTTTSF